MSGGVLIELKVLDNFKFHEFHGIPDGWSHLWDLNFILDSR